MNASSIGLSPFLPYCIWAANKDVNTTLPKNASKITRNYCFADLDLDFRFEVPGAQRVYVQTFKLKCQQTPFAECSDTIQDLDETDTDCGGPTCPARCAAPLKCLVSEDCQSHNCVANVCQAATCTDGIVNQNETDGDCGGSTCPLRCADYRQCAVDADCASLICRTENFSAPYVTSYRYCYPASCTNNVQDGCESDVDCGRQGCCPPCVPGQMCTDAGDGCTTQQCTGNICQP